MNAARAVFAERGMDFEVRDLCDRAGVGVATLYRNFPTRLDLLDAVLEDFRDEAESMHARIEAEADPAKAVALLFECAIDLMDHHIDLVPILQAHARDQRNVSTRYAKQVIQRAQWAGVVRTDIPAGVLTDGLFAFLDLYVELLQRLPAPLARDAVRRLWRAIEAQPEERPRS